MNCASKLYTNTDIDVTITLDGILIANIAAVTITLTNGSTIKTYTDGSGVTIGGSTIELSIPAVGAESISAEGVYVIKILATDTGGNVRGLTPCPGSLTFYK